jgi:hypothetical protein
MRKGHFIATALRRSAAEPQPKRGTAILAVSVTGETPVPQCRGQQRWPYITRKMFAQKTSIYGIAMQRINFRQFVFCASRPLR